MSYIDIIHFNDVYHIEPGTVEPIGGAARFKTKIDEISQKLSQENENNLLPLVLFSGDAFNPSPQSTVSKGKHMVPILNELGIEVACYGNHDFDFGVPALEELKESCNFPWIISNLAVNKEHPDVPLAQGKLYHIFKRGSLKIGVIGLVEKEWLLTISSLPSDYYYQDFIEVAQSLSKKLREEEKVDLIIALTHMRLPNDELLARSCPEEIDIILGGHDHFYHVGTGCQLFNDKNEKIDNISQTQNPEIPNIRVIKSDTDFRCLSQIRFFLESKEVNVHRHSIGGDIKPFPEIEKMVSEQQAKIGETLKVVIGYCLKPWDTRSETVRLCESEIGNLVSDVLLYGHPGSDVTLICGGTLRSDTIYPAGPVTVGDIMSILPFDDPVVVITIKGKHLRAALEASLFEFPKQEGRFPQVSGLRLKFDPSSPQGERLCEVLVRKISHLSPEKRSAISQESKNEDEKKVLTKYEPLRDDHVYRVVTRYYMAKGFDGFSPLKNSQFLVDEEEGTLISTFMRRYFLGLKYVALMIGALNGINPNNAALATGRAWRYYTKLAKKNDSFEPESKEDPDFVQSSEILQADNSKSMDQNNSNPASISDCLHASLLHVSTNEVSKELDKNDPDNDPHHESKQRCLPYHLKPYVTVDPRLEDRIVQISN